MKASHSERRQRAIDDHAMYGNTQSGIYKGIKWEAIRSYGGSSPPPKRWDIATAPIYHWCGYIHVPNTEENYKCFTRSECTYESSDGVLGFDCGHSHDYDVYRDFPYVLSIIQDTIDNIIKTKGEGPFQ